MRELVYRLQKPTQYLGGEWGRIAKAPATVRARVALAFPDFYEVGMSYVGGRILYEAVNRVEGLAAERVFAPADEAVAVMREAGTPLATLETDTPLAACDVVAFHLTHELCYTSVLHMLDLAGIPFRSADRAASGTWPLVIAGGGCAFNAEPMAPFFDAMVIGDGETALIDIMEAVAQARKAGLTRLELLHKLTAIPGVYIPEFFDYDPETGVKPLVAGYEQVVKAVVADLDTAPFPSCQVVPFAQAVHDRLSVEIARGCTRGCRFCHAGMVYRPVRERSLETLDKLVGEGLGRTGYEELSFLSLSTGDFSALESLFAQSIDRCRRDQIAVSLPSLRAGTLSDSILTMMAGIRRTGATLAPEAATQRLRDVINKGITEEDILSHTKRLFEHGWQQVKLYFMIGLPTETEDDVRGIFELAQRVLAQAPRGAKRLQVTAAISPFVPKPHTPFQWDAQITLEQIRGRVNFLRELFATERRLTLRWHEPEMSFLEGVFARGGRELAPIVEAGWRKGALFCSWLDRFDLAPWLEVFAEAGLDPADWLAGRDPDKPLPWDHLSCGVSAAYLRLERRRALEGTVTGDCRYGECTGCGVCNEGGRKSPLAAKAPIMPRLNRPTPESEAVAAPPPPPKEDLTRKAVHFRVWYAKNGSAVYLSQLELGRVIERSLRRAGLKPGFSAGYHPMPLISFGRALPVGVSSQAEWLGIFLREAVSPDDFTTQLNPNLPEGLVVVGVEELAGGRKVAHPVLETFELTVPEAVAAICLQHWQDFTRTEAFPVAWESKKGPRSLDAKTLVTDVAVVGPATVRFVCDFGDTYLSPLRLAEAVCPELVRGAYGLAKTGVAFAEGGGWPPS
ncbi:TIGR03960 family B12-binding radical SAM protein [Desulfovibrio aerotolerans]|uniref:TIGR03960 family B12-binding radical SAM protein n=1 Tax=Solidesulfovibrio aerotolerans TaxID=295255 RepID=A0A7C9IU53_9BACT|nr:TIGR03960 family B12-binding radical SAM protein [Solidesulfovibrio aerotolerans]MYL82083.1 TIGR03960 family B12-binding radical SAM protein [Solidesulfovibrio aerotolerans]